MKTTTMEPRQTGTKSMKAGTKTTKAGAETMKTEARMMRAATEGMKMSATTARAAREATRTSATTTQPAAEIAKTTGAPVKAAIVGAGMALLLAAAPLQAQDSWSLELRGNAAVPTSEIAGDELKTGVGLEANVGYRFYEHMSLYAGWDWTHFGANESFAGPDMDFEETGYVLGMRWEHPFRSERGHGLAAWVRAGGTYKHIEVEDDEGEIVGDSGHGLGWEVGAGLSIPLTASWRLTPGIRYKALSRELEVGSATTDWDLNDVSFELGGRWHF